MESLLPLVELVDNSYLFHLVNGGIAPAGPHPHSRITSQQHELEGNALIDLWRLVVFFVRKINLSHIWSHRSHLVTLVTSGPIGQIGQIWSHWSHRSHSSHLVTSGHIWSHRSHLSHLVPSVICSFA